MPADENTTGAAMNRERSKSHDRQTQCPDGFLDDAIDLIRSPIRNEIHVTAMVVVPPRQQIWLASLTRRLCAVTCGVALLLAPAGPAISQQPSGVVDDRPGTGEPDQRLRRGVNFSHWFAQSQHGYSESHLSSFIVDHDIELVRKAGFTHVRLPISMERSFASGQIRVAYVATLVEKIGKINQAGLAVVVDLHPSPDEKQALIDLGDDSFFVEGWRRLALALGHFNPRLVMFELMNEPVPMAGPQWRALQQRTIDAIRTVAPENTLIANPGGWSGIEDYTEFRPYIDANVVYTAHVYEPLLFTHQGTTWAWDVASQVKGVSWPLPPASAGQHAARSGATEEAVRQLRHQISDGQFQVRWLIDRFDRLAQWQRRSGHPQIYIGEFGVYRLVAPEAASLRWHQEVRQAFEARGWGWAVWDYAGGFGIRRNGKALDVPMLEALGLREADTTERQP
jgi:hypothetical protein